MTKGPQSIRDWLPILNWGELPNFGNCHTHLSPDKFRQEYYLSGELRTLYENICTSATNGVNAANVRLAGNPGAGKTSFLYALKLGSESHVPPLSDFFFYIFHVNRAHHSDGEVRAAEVLQNVRQAWASFFRANGHVDTAIRIESQGGSDKEVVNRLADHYVQNKAQFSKCFIFVVDNADLLPGEEVAEVATVLLRSLEQASVKKWLVLRHSTYDGYRGEARRLIEQFFPDPYSFPDIPLSELVSHRIAASAGVNSPPAEPKNPFSPEICDREVGPICEANLREGLSLLKSILEENLPKGIDKSADQTFIQGYLRKAAVRTYLSSGKLVNLHTTPLVCTLYPLALDLLCCAESHSSEEIIFAATSECMRHRDNISDKRLVVAEDVPRLRPTDFNLVLEQLQEHGLIVHDKTRRQIRTTPRGSTLCEFATRDAYYDFCRRRDPRTNDAATRYWGRAAIQIAHTDVVESLSKWRKQK